MKKMVALLSLSALLLSANFAMAFGGHADAHVKADLLEHAGLKLNSHIESKAADLDVDSHSFVLMDQVKSVGSNSLVVTAKFVTHDKTAANTDVTIKTDSDTKFRMANKEIKLSDMKANYIVLVKGEKSDNNYVADWIQVKAQTKKVYGEVTAKTNTSITLKNSVTGNTITVPLNDDTKIMINGEAKTTSDIEVGDKGMVKLKAVLNTFVAKFIHLFR